MRFHFIHCSSLLRSNMKIYNILSSIKLLDEFAKHMLQVPENTIL